MTGSPTITLSTPTAGQNFTDKTGVANYAITNNRTNRTISAQLGAAMPSGLTLKVDVAAPQNSGGASAGTVTLTDTADRPVVTNSGPVTASSVAITYTLSATSEAEATGETSPTVDVIYTITNT